MDATQIRLALERDVSEDYEAAFNHYQNGGMFPSEACTVRLGLAGAEEGPIPSSVHLCWVSKALCWPCRTYEKDSSIDNNSLHTYKAVPLH